MNKYVLYWWSFFCAQIVLFLALVHFGLAAFVFESDVTYITYLISIVHIIATLLIGWCIWKRNDALTQGFWYTAESQLGLGMVGTLIGFIIMLHSAFNGGSDISEIKNSISMIGIGMGVAIRATLLGLVSGMLIKAQLLFLEKQIGQDNPNE